ncbi:MAG TPA: anti-sigma regulatory factor [Candidatus Syntrophoarchaeum butanivorans]|uniref:Anti-sigma regulatory factor n=1 Tax=Candidatus Syntropharchaeum butanivorans TaxID=1839936 RepID=A0A1F2P5X0_9EURY|nr:MAG: serine/threonine protein kinase [Candidatus Syntrophoarchaeum butanivorans]RJS70918.1 MAG: anti-sigma regulatory factor [Candidatus Syntrophoarchaeum sp. WYZ-LMO15]HDM36301.1 anti-sigma regulatory factor [Candidatus Syntrophoarchaeum butanivorans]HEC57440.1 anti-sigma regulatory factor [Candidatus Syntrophoarchaeum butanivorans]
MDEQTIEVRRDIDVILARNVGRKMANEIGFGELDQTRITTAISELARNIVIHANRGKVVIREIQKGDRRGIEVVCTDDGPGIEDIEAALRDGYTTAGGLGIGMTGAKRLMDEFHVESVVGVGTTVIVKKWLR